MYGLFECMSSGCVAQKGEHAKISCQVIQGWDRTLAGHLKYVSQLVVAYAYSHDFSNVFPDFETTSRK